MRWYSGSIYHAPSLIASSHRPTRHSSTGDVELCRVGQCELAVRLKLSWFDVLRISYGLAVNSLYYTTNSHQIELAEFEPYDAYTHARTHTHTHTHTHTLRWDWMVWA